MEYIEKFSITIEELAEKHGKKQQAIRNYIDRYPEDLKGHYRRENGSTWLDEFAVAFIESRLKPRKVDNIIINQALEDKIRELQDKLIAAHEKNLELIEEKETLRLQAEESLRLIEAHQKDQEQIQEELTATVNQNEELHKQLQAEREARAKAEATAKASAEATETLQAQADEQAAELERLKKRTLWERIRNK